MCHARFLSWVCCAACVISLSSSARTAYGAALLGLDYQTGDLYTISTTDASMTLVGHTGLTHLSSFVFGTDGNLYGYTTGTSPALYRIDPDTAVADYLAPLTKTGGGVSIFESGMTVSPTGTVYGINMGTQENNKLFTLDLATGEATVVHTLVPTDTTFHDVNGLVWYNNKLIGLDECQNGIVQIDPLTGQTDVLYSLAALNQNGTPVLGSIGDMVLDGNLAYFSTASQANPSYPPANGSNSLYSIDLTNGDLKYIGALSLTTTTAGISALAIVPEPAMLGFIALGSLLFWPRRR
jgi:hypothetical protein